MNNLLGIFIVASLMTTGILFAYAETITEEIPHEIGDRECQTFTDIMNVPFTQCYYGGIGPADQLRLWLPAAQGPPPEYDL